MSGIYIPGMEMPKTWRDCMFSNGAAQCKLDNMELCGLCYRQRCPLIHVPPHGRLIDADGLTGLCDIMADKFDGVGESIWNQFRTTVEWTPTVLPAEDGEC